MKRLFALLVLCASAWGQGTVRQTISQIGASQIYVVQIDWTGDASTGAVPATALLGFPGQVQGYRVVNAETKNGSPTPTNNYSVTFLDSAGVDALGSVATSVSSSSSQSFSGSPTAAPIYGTLTFTLTGNSVGGAQGRVLVFLAPFSQVIGLSPSAPSFPAQGADLVYASPCGSSGSPGFRALCLLDLGSLIIPIANGGTNSGTASGARTNLAVPGLADNNTYTGLNTYGNTSTFNGGTTFNAGLQAGGATLTRPNRSGTGSPNARDNCSNVGETYFQTDATAGSNMWGCTTTGTPGTWTQLGAATGFPSGTQTQFFRIQPNTGNNTTIQAASFAQLNLADYNFPAQTPGGSLSSGVPATVTLTPCPLGIVTSGTYQTSLYISAGTGTAEAVTLTGGSCTSGAGTGTVQFTPTNNHTGAWTVTSATAGLQEAMNVINTNGGGTIALTPKGQTCTATVHAKITTPPVYGAVFGWGQNNRSICRAEDYANGDMFSIPSTSQFIFQDFGILNGTTAAQSSGAAFHPVQSAPQFQRVNVYGGFAGWLLEATQTANCVGCGYVADTHTSYGLKIESLTGTPGLPSTDTHWTNGFFYSGVGSSFAVRIQGADSVTFSENSIAGYNVQIYIAADAGAYISTIKIENNVLDASLGYGVDIEDPNAAGMGLITIAGNTILDEVVSSSSLYGINVGLASPSAQLAGVIISHNWVQGWGFSGVAIGAISSVQIIGNNLGGNNLRNAAGAAGLALNGGTTQHVDIIGNFFGGGNEYYGIAISNTSSRIVIKDNDFTGVTTAALFGTANLSNSIIGGNIGVNDLRAFSAILACSSGTEGTFVAVSDSNTATWGANVAGGGANHISAYCDGTNWTVAAK